MDNNEQQAAKASLESIKQAALQHYADISAKAHHWNSLVPKAIEAYQEWISIEERVPEYTERHTMWNDETNQPEPYGEPAFQIVLAYNEELGIFKAKYEKRGHWSEISSISIKGSVKPTHWQHLPTPPTKLL